MKTLLARGEPFYFPGGPAGCLLVHGFTGAPDEMRRMGEYLAEREFTVLGIRLFGHATQPADMNRARWRDWLANVEDGYHLLSGHCPRVVAMGFSLGGALSLLAAGQLPLAGVVVMDTPARMPDARVRRLRRLIPLLSKLIPFLSHESLTEAEPQADSHLHYSVYPVRATAELHDALEAMRRGLGAVRVPTLLMYAESGRMASQDDADAIYRGLGTEDKQLEWIANSGHVIPRGAGRMAAFEAAARFARRVTE